MLHTSKYPSRRSGRPEMVREVLSRTRAEGNRMADEKRSKISRRSFLQKTAVGAAGGGAVGAAATSLERTEKVQAGAPPGGGNTPGMAHGKDAAQGARGLGWGAQQ